MSEKTMIALEELMQELPDAKQSNNDTQSDNDTQNSHSSLVNKEWEVNAYHEHCDRFITTLSQPFIGKLYQKIANVGAKIQNKLKKKSGKNLQKGFAYAELSDFAPFLYIAAAEEKIGLNISADTEKATLTIIDCETGETTQFIHPFFAIIQGNTRLTPHKAGMPPNVENDTSITALLQRSGAIMTYIRRYLLMNAFGIAIPDAIDRTEATIPSSAQKTYGNQFRK